jgi:adenosylhomocysteine nucleosidase
MRKIGVIAALGEEAEAFFPGQGRADDLGALALRRLQLADAELAILMSGIGKVNAAIAATLLILQERCDLLLVIGTAGLISKRSEHCFWLSSAVQHDYGAERSDGFVHYTAGTYPIGPAQVVPFLTIADPGLGLPHVRVASGDSFVECPDHARFLAEGLSADLVDMESAAIAQVAHRFGIPWAGIRAVSDGANGDSSGDFRSNLRRAARLAAEAGERFVVLAAKLPMPTVAGAPPLPVRPGLPIA